jgi:hypothetical protein
VNYSGDRIEQSSSVLHVAMLAALHRVTTLDVVTIGTLFSVAMGGAAVLALFFLVRRTASERGARCLPDYRNHTVLGVLVLRRTRSDVRFGACHPHGHGGR